MNAHFSPIDAEDVPAAYAAVFHSEIWQDDGDVHDPCNEAVSADCEEPSVDQSNHLTRAKRKQLECEISWREILSRGGEYAKAFVAAADREG